MFRLNYLKDGCPTSSLFADTKEPADAVTAITNDQHAGQTAGAIASGMVPDDEFVRPGSFKIDCVAGARAAEAIIEDWARPGLN